MENHARPRIGIALGKTHHTNGRKFEQGLSRTAGAAA
jgi:hypothetical protein